MKTFLLFILEQKECKSSSKFGKNSSNEAIDIVSVFLSRVGSTLKLTYLSCLLCVVKIRKIISLFSIV